MAQAMLWNFDSPVTPADVLIAVPREGRFTRRMAAQAMRRAKSPTMTYALEHLVTLGFLDREIVTLPNGVGMVTYEVNDSGRAERAELLIKAVSRTVF